MMRMDVSKWCALALVVLGISLSSPAPAQQVAGAQVSSQTLGGDVFVGGSDVTVREPVGGDLFVAGGTIEVAAAVGGDAVVTGGRVRVGSDVAHSLYAAGGQLDVNGRIGRNARMAGGQVELVRGSEVAGNVSIAGGQVRIDGTVHGSVQAAGGRVRIDGVVDGDVVAASGQLELGPQARIAGTLRYRSGAQIVQDPAAQVAGGIETLPPRVGPPARGGPGGEPPGRRPGEGGGAFGMFGMIGGLWTIGLMLLAAAAIAAFPALSGGVATTLRERTGTSVAVGFVVLVCVPAAVLVLMITVVGVPLALFVLLAYLALMPVAYVASAVGVGDWLLRRWYVARSAEPAWRIGAACAAVMVLALLGWIPVVGWLVGLVALLAGLGALALQLRRGARLTGPPALA